MAITRANGTTFSSGGFTSSTFNPTIPSLPTGSNRCIVLRLWVCGPNDALNSGLTLGGQAADYTLDSGGSQWYWGRIQHYIWMDSTIGSMSGTTWATNTFGAAVHYNGTIDYYEGVAQSAPTQSSYEPDTSGDDIPAQTTVSGDWLLSMCGERYDNDGITYDGSGTSRLAHVADVTNQDGSVSAADLTATGTSTSDSYTTGGGNATRSWVVLGQASSSITVGPATLALTTYALSLASAITVGPATLALTTYALTVSGVSAITVGPAALTLTTYQLTVSGASAITVGPALMTLTTYTISVTGGGALVIGGVPIDVHVDSPEFELVPMAPDERRAANGASLRTITSARGYKDRGQYRTLPLSASDRTTQLAALTTGVPEAVSGWLAAGATTAMAEGVTVDRLRGVDLYVISFTLIQSS